MIDAPYGKSSTAELLAAMRNTPRNSLEYIKLDAELKRRRASGELLVTQAQVWVTVAVAVFVVVAVALVAPWLTKMSN